MVHRHHRLLKGEGQRLGKGTPDQQCARKTGAGGIGDGIYGGQIDLSLGQRLSEQWHHPTDMVARGQFGHNAAVSGMHGDLGMECLPQQFRSAGLRIQRDQRHPGFVTRGLHAQHQQRMRGVGRQKDRMLRGVHGALL